MTEFTEMDIQKDVDEMEESELRKTLTDFMEQHEKNTKAHDELRAEWSEKVEDREQKIEALEERLGEFKQRRAEEAAEHVNMPADILAERFDFSELDQIIDEAEEFSEEPEEDESEEESDYLTSFAEREQKGRRDGSSGGPSKQHRERAKRAMKNQGFPVGE